MKVEALPDGMEVKKLWQEIEELSRANARLREECPKDEVTGLFNRRYFEEELGREFFRVRRYKGRTSLIILDIDNFRNINRIYGRKMGDDLLKEVATTLRVNLRAADFVARIGSDEFGLILPESDIDGAFMVAERMRLKISRNTYYFGKTEMCPTVSLGATCYKGWTPRNKEEWIKIADLALKEAKRRGGNQAWLR